MDVMIMVKLSGFQNRYSEAVIQRENEVANRCMEKAYPSTQI